jgi:DNA polymerase/3'-5' exonuclease PolX
LDKVGIEQLCIKTGDSVSKTKRKSINLEYLWRTKYSKYWRKVDLKFFAYESKISAMMYFTGSRNFNRRMRERLKQIGYLLNQYGLYKKELKTHRTGKKGGIKYVYFSFNRYFNIFNTTFFSCSMSF